MKPSRCPRCDDVISARYPVHISCWLQRAEYWIVGGVAILVIIILGLLVLTGAIVFGGNFL